MSEDREPFFTPAERQYTLILRPQDWRQWWRAERLLPKVLVAGIGLMLVVGLVALPLGYRVAGGSLLGTVGIVLSWVLLLALANILAASVRWVLRQIGVAAWWRKNKHQVIDAARGFFWLGVIVLVIVGLWPYLSLDPAKSWQALKNGVPVERLTMEKKPHDCDFATAPLGAKNCHYETRAFVMKDDGGPNAQRSVIVSYERVQD